MKRQPGLLIVLGLAGTMTFFAATTVVSAASLAEDIDYQVNHQLIKERLANQYPGLTTGDIDRLIPFFVHSDQDTAGSIDADVNSALQAILGN